MTQIKENQIIPSQGNRSNAASSPPRDLSQPFTVQEANGVLTFKTPVVANPTYSLPTGLATSPPIPQDQTALAGPNVVIPSILSVKSQTVNIQDDGTATIDVVLIVQDIPGVTEYDIRVAKVAGNL